MLIKIIFGVISVAACTAGGYWLSLRFVKRRAFFLDFCAFNQLMQREVGFAKSTLKEIFAKADYGAEFTQPIRMFEDKKAIELPLLNKRENEFLQSYFRVLGKTDSATQLAFFNAQKAPIEGYLNTAKEDETKYRPLYIKLGFLIGLILFVIML